MGITAMMIYSIHGTDVDRLAAVTGQMRILGAPTLRVVDCADHYQALEGSHRLAAASELGLVPKLIIYAPNDVIDITEFDWYDAANWAVGSETTHYLAGEVAGELFNASASRDYSF